MIKLILIIVLMIIVSVFSIQNMHPVTLNLFFKGPVQAPLIFLLMGTFMTGAITVFVINIAQKWSKVKILKDEKKKFLNERKNLFKKRKELYSSPV